MSTGGNKNLHRVRHIEGHCNNIHKGKVRVGFWIGNCPGYGNADGYTGCQCPVCLLKKFLKLKLKRDFRLK